MLEPLDDTFAEHATRLRRIAAIAAMAFALGGTRDASAEAIFDNSTGTSSSGGYVVGEYSAGSVYALGGNFTVPVGAPLHLVGGSIGVSFGASSAGLNEMDLEIAEMSAAPILSARSWRVRRSATCPRFLHSLILPCRQKRFSRRARPIGWWALRRPRCAPRRAEQRSSNRQGASKRPLAIS
jgi:hypothetical protein